MTENYALTRRTTGHEGKSRGMKKKAKRRNEGTTHLLHTFTTHISQLMDAWDTTDLVHFIQKHNA